MNPMLSTSVNTDQIRFFFFGCWNKGGCPYNEYLQKNVNHIKENNTIFAYDFGVILGDNIYPNDSSKSHSVEITKNGMMCLDSIGVKLYVVLGNHDVTQCDIINQQIINLQNWTLPRNFYSEVKQKNNLKIKIIVIDTNLLASDKIYDSVIFTNNCTLSSNINQNQEQMIFFIKQELKEYDKFDWIIVAGHDPIASFKCKSTRCGVIIHSRIKEMIDLFKDIDNLIYICADTHNFQYDIITENGKSIKEIVVGTGGAHPDKILPEFKTVDQLVGNYHIKMIDTYTPYGYCDMTLTKDKVSFTYYKLSDANHQDNEVYPLELHQFTIVKNGKINQKAESIYRKKSDITQWNYLINKLKLFY